MAYRSVLAMFGIAMTAAMQPARACEYDSFLFQLPGETRAQAEARSKQLIADNRLIAEVDREKRDLHDASRIYLARVMAKLSESSVDLKGLTSFKGGLPAINRSLVDQSEGGLCSDAGDGHGATGSVGDLVVVFEGLPKSIYRPRGIDSFPVASVRTAQLLDWLRTYGKDLED